jgi:tetratricopeptide (TPR) repeat protein
MPPSHGEPTAQHSPPSNLQGDRMPEDLGDALQHPRRHLGGRHLAQARRFLNLAERDPERADQNVAWAEQHARQALLHDFTEEDSWRMLTRLKVMLNDGPGVHAVLEDLFAVLGRDPERAGQLRSMDLVHVAEELLEAALLVDPLDAARWWTNIEVDLRPNVDDFATRCRRLDFSDPRAAIVFGRRLERLRQHDEDLFVELSAHLLAHRPQNHELWLELGRLHETRGRHDEAWLCYDHVQTLRPHLDVRDRYQDRLNTALEGGEAPPWSPPDVETRDAFLEGMLGLRARLASDEPPPEPEAPEPESDGTGVDPEHARLLTLLEQDEVEEVFFLARRATASGEAWAEEVLSIARERMGA